MWSLHPGWEDVIREWFDFTYITGNGMFYFKNHLSIFFKTAATKSGDKFLLAKWKVLSFFCRTLISLRFRNRCPKLLPTKFRLLKPGVTHVPYLVIGHQRNKGDKM